MSIYDPLSKALGIESDSNFNFDEWSKFSIQFDSNIQREEAIRRNSEFVKCDKCGVIGNRPNMTRCHFENCQTEFKECIQCGKK